MLYLKCLLSSELRVIVISTSVKYNILAAAFRLPTKRYATAGRSVVKSRCKRESSRALHIKAASVSGWSSEINWNFQNIQCTNIRFSSLKLHVFQQSFSTMGASLREHGMCKHECRLLKWYFRSGLLLNLQSVW